MRHACLIVFLLTCISMPALADWQYTRWGMSPEQVVAASKGSANLLPPDQRPRLPPLETSAKGTFQDGALTLRTTFTFDTSKGGLTCVWYGVAEQANSEPFKQMLLKRYGEPAETSSLPAIDMTSMTWLTGGDRIDFQATRGDRAFVSHCKDD